MIGKPVSIRIPEELLERLDAVAKDQRRSRSNLILMLLERGLEEKVLPDIPRS